MKKYIIITIFLITSNNYAMQKKTDEQKEQELFARMTAMRLEQARRTQQATPPQPTPSMYESQPHQYADGIPQEYHWRPTATDNEQAKKPPKKTPAKESTDLNMFAVDYASPEYIQGRRDSGYLVHQAPDGLTCFYKPGTEGLIEWFLINFRLQRQAMQSNSSSE